CALHADFPFRATGSPLAGIDFTKSAAEAPRAAVHSKLPHDAFLQSRMQRIYVLRVQRGAFSRAAEHPAVGHHFGKDSPIICRSCRQWLEIQQERLRSPRTGPVTPRSEDSVTGHDATGEVRRTNRTSRLHPPQ